MGLVSILSVLLSAVGCTMHVVGLSVIYWIVSRPFRDGEGMGLWQTCSRMIRCTTYRYTSDYWKATQAFVVVGILIGLVGLILAISSLFKNRKALHITTALVNILAGLCVLLAIIILAINWNMALGSQWGWGFIMSTCSSFFFIGAGITSLMAFKKTL